MREHEGEGIPTKEVALAESATPTDSMYAERTTMHTPEEVRRATQALVKEAEQLSAQSRQQRMLLRCLSVNLLKLHARLKHQGKSVSLHGQGLTREWRSFTITIERERTA